MKDEDYIAEIRKAVDGEMQGEILFAALASAAALEHRHKLEALAGLERRTAAEMQELVERYALTVSPANAEKALVRAKKYLGMDWREILGEWATWIPKYVDLYDRLAEQARPADAKALNFLAEHERALHDFIALELSGDTDGALARVTALLKS